MKIEKLEFENINSLAGKFTIDFTNPALAGDGIFVITGPTGAGKTTLLDAISFALYGETARQSGVTKERNELMTHGCKACTARVTFTHGGKRYAVSAEQKRTRGNAQTPFGEWKRKLECIGDDGTAQTLAGSITTVKQGVHDITGLTFENFKRCMMLAQGEFASFLKAGETERAQVLTTITGTEIYQKIGDMVVDTCTEKKRALEAEHPQETLPDAIRKEREKARDGLQRKMDELSAQADELKAAANWLKRIGELTEKAAKAGDALGAARKANEDFLSGTDHAHLLAAERAAGVQQSFTVREEKKNALAATRNEVQHADAEVQRLTPAVQQAKEKAQTAKREMEDKSPALEAELVRIANELRPLEQEIALARQAASQARADAKAADDAAKQAELQHCKARDAFEQAQAQLAENRGKLRERVADKELGAALPAVRVRLEEWQRVHAADGDIPATPDVAAELAALRPERDGLLAGHTIEQLRRMRDAWQFLAQHETDLRNKTNAKQLAGETLAKLEQEKLPSLEDALQMVNDRTEALNLTRARANLQEKLDELYVKFKEGKLECCPCCGAATPGEHRQALEAGALAAAQEKLEAAKLELQDVQARHDRHQRDLAGAREALDKAGAEYEKLCESFYGPLSTLELTMETIPEHSEPKAAELAGTMGRVEKLDARIAALEKLAVEAEKRDALHAAARPFAAKLPDNLPAACALVGGLEKRAAEYAAANDAVAKGEKELAGLEATAVEKEAAAKAARDLLQAKAEQASARDAELKVLLERKATQWGDESADAREQRIRGDKEKLATGSRNADAELVRRQNERQGQQQLLDDAHRRAKVQETALTEAEEGFAAALREAQFADEAAYREAAEWLPQREALAAEKQLLQQEFHTAERLLNFHRRDLEELQAGKLTDAKPEELAARLDELDGQRRQAEEEWAREKSLLERDDDARNANRELEARLAPLREELHYWELLKTVLGGSKESFKRYAQQITFDLLIKSANQRLARLTDRYVLKQDRTSMLGLLVVDRWQDDEKGRSVSNLSGGESFIVSLALALGLAQMVGNDTQLDTLFLDEGFGTLDAEQLEKVLDALANLRADGKLIGIISHVEQLKERISQGIEITRHGNNGRSTITPREGVTAEPA